MNTAEQPAHDNDLDLPQGFDRDRPGTAAQTAAMKQIAAILEAWMQRECTSTEGAATRLGITPARLVHVREGRFELLSLDELAEMLGRACAANYRSRP